jgi:AcrR family transcriptional regulator
MSPGLRERKRRAAMDRIQEVALDLFDERGFARVSVEEIASAAEVSPSSVYRYFGTKEGIILSDDFDFLNDDEISDAIDLNDLGGSISDMVSRFDLSAGDGIEGKSLAERRIRYFFEEPAVRRAAYETLANAAKRIAQVLAEQGALPAPEAHVLATALVFAYFAALEEWHRDPKLAIADTFQQALNALQRN